MTPLLSNIKAECLQNMLARRFFNSRGVKEGLKLKVMLTERKQTPFAASCLSTACSRHSPSGFFSLAGMGAL
jgi:hypothetical protein